MRTKCACEERIQVQSRNGPLIFYLIFYWKEFCTFTWISCRITVLMCKTCFQQQTLEHGALYPEWHTEQLSKYKQCHLQPWKRTHGWWAIIALILSGWLVWDWIKERRADCNSITIEDIHIYICSYWHPLHFNVHSLTPSQALWRNPDLQPAVVKDFQTSRISHKAYMSEEKNIKINK